jgi:glycosyltransferase involved in cell wall biosynthesis
LRLNDLRVVFVNWRGIEHPEAGGAEKYAWELATRTAASGARTTYLTAASPGSPGRETIDGVEVVRRGSTLSVYPAALAWLARHRRSVDVVIDCQNGIPFFSPLVVGKSRAVILVVHHVHQEQFATRFAPRMAAIGRALEGPVSRVVYRRHTVVAVSPSTRHGIRRRLSLPGPVVIVPNGTPEIALRDAPRAPVPTILCLGRLVPHKRVDHLVQACATLRHRFPNLRVDIVGDGPARSELGKLVADLGLGDVVRLHGRVDEAKKARLLSEAWLAVNPSMSEGWGITVMEAAAAGVPSLAYDVAGLRDSILDGETGWLIPEGSDLGGGLAQALAGLLNPRSAAQWSARAQAWASCFTWDDSAARLAGVILDEAGRARRRASTAPERRRTDAACVLEVDGIDPAQVAALRRTLRRSDVVVTDGNRVLVLMYGCDERNGHLAAERAGLTGRVRVRVAQQRDFLTLQDHSVPDWPFEVPA